MGWDNIITLFGGGAIVAIINAIASRGKNNTDIAQSNIDTAIKLKNEAVKEYTTAEEKLQECRKLLNEVQDELDTAKSVIKDLNLYIAILKRLLRDNNIDYPPKK
jgi:chromosome segregation ATPase